MDKQLKLLLGALSNWVFAYAFIDALILSLSVTDDHGLVVVQISDPVTGQIAWREPQSRWTWSIHTELIIDYVHIIFVVEWLPTTSLIWCHILEWFEVDTYQIQTCQRKYI